MKELSSDEVLNQWMGNPSQQSQWNQACHTQLKKLMQQALALGADAVEKAEMKLSTYRGDGWLQVVLALPISEVESAVIRLTSRGKRAPDFDLGTASRRGVGRATPQIIFSSKEGLSSRSTRATASVLLERFQVNLESLAKG